MLVKYLHFYAADQGLASSHHEGPHSKYFRLRDQMVVVTAASLCCSSERVTVDNVEMNGCGCVLTTPDIQKETASRVRPAG